MGRVAYFEFQADDIERAFQFYGDVFGWRFQKLPNSDYWMIDTGEGPGIHGAILRRRGPPPMRGQSLNGAVVTLQVDSVEESLAAAIAAGGSMVRPRSSVPGIGYTAYLADTEGNIFGLYEPNEAAT